MTYVTLSSRLQNGIYYGKGQTPGSSLAVLLLRLKIKDAADAGKVRDILAELWQMYADLEKGLVRDSTKLLENGNIGHKPYSGNLPSGYRNIGHKPYSGNLPSGYRNIGHKPYTGNLSVLIGYGPRFFELPGLRKSKPQNFDDKGLFFPPDSNGGGSLMEDTEMNYANDVTENGILDDHILIQFIGDSELSTNRAMLETWKILQQLKKSNMNNLVSIRTYFNGFNRPDKRSWLGFHDGVSNIKINDRLAAISIKNTEVNYQDSWTVNGTFLSYLKMVIDLEKWDRIPEEKQELIIGRDKLTGCPISRVDKVTGRKIIVNGCPKPGTFEIFDKGNESFREHPPYGGYGMLDDALNTSHIGQMYNRGRYLFSEAERNRIFRQGYEFLEPTNTPQIFRVGLHFMSFQGGIDRIHNLLKKGFGKPKNNAEAQAQLERMSGFLSVRAGGIFLVPPVTANERFPGEFIF